jgi:glycosyltransferase involved in cell wall biosynthesis
MAINNSFPKLASLSVFFPCYNEEKNVPIMVEQAVQFLPTIAEKFEIIVVNDGSTDQTAAVTKNLQKKYPQLRLVSHKDNLGYGASLRTGFNACRYDWIFYTDGDAQFDMTELTKFIPYTQEYEVILGYRQNRAEGWSRVLNAKLFKLYIDVLFRVGVKDIDCAFKLMRADLIQNLDLFSTGAFICAEYLYKLKKQGVRFKQLPVKHLPRRYGQPTGARPDVIIKALLDAMRLYLKMKFGLNL